MATTTVVEEHIDLTPIRAPSTTTFTTPLAKSSLPPTYPTPNEAPEPTAYTVSAIPDGGYGWIIVLGCSMTTFCHNGIINCWGVLQAALLNSTLPTVSPSTLAYVGSLGLSGGALYGLVAVRLTRHIGCRLTILLGITLMGLSLLGASFCTANLAGLFVTYGVIGGLGMAMVYAVANTLPVQYFSAHLGLANGLIKLGGGIGGCIMALALEAL